MILVPRPKALESPIMPQHDTLHAFCNARLPSIVFAHAPRGMALPRGGAFDEFEDFPAQ